MDKFGFNLEKIVSRSDRIDKVAKDGLMPGDYVMVKTTNSIYTIRKQDNNLYEVQGGWFDQQGLSPATLTIKGCTWGGSIIHIGLVAACGLYIEFGNNVITSPISKIVVIKSRQLN